MLQNTAKPATGVNSEEGEVCVYSIPLRHTGTSIQPPALPVRDIRKGTTTRISAITMRRKRGKEVKCVQTEKGNTVGNYTAARLFQRQVAASSWIAAELECPRGV
jgi:hypothetical protein